jgi:hypothetical protein
MMKTLTYAATTWDSTTGEAHPASVTILTAPGPIMMELVAYTTHAGLCIEADENPSDWQLIAVHGDSQAFVSVWRHVDSQTLSTENCVLIPSAEDIGFKKS